MMETKIYYNDNSFPLEEYTEFIHKAFKERIDQNLNFGCASFTSKTFKKKLKDHFIVVISDSNTIVGTVALAVVNNKGFIYGLHEYLAVSHSCRGRKIGGLLEKHIEKIAKSQNLSFVLSDTAVGATSSVKFHTKSGFKKILFRKYSSTNYISYVFIKPIKISFVVVLLLVLRLPLLGLSKILLKNN